MANSSSNRATRGRAGFTLIEMLVAVGLTVLLMTMVVSVMSQVMANISGNRGTIEMTDRLRYVRDRLQRDLAGVTLFPNPPARPENGEGYFEYIDGPMGPQPSRGACCLNTDEPSSDSTYDFSGNSGNSGPYKVDLSVGDLDDILMFTSKSNDEPFTGLYNTVPIQSSTAEIAYFVRGTTLYRRVLLVRPDLPLTAGTGFYAMNDISAHQEDGPSPQNTAPTAGTGAARLVGNSLSDLTKRENRYGHQPYVWPYDARFWSYLGLPTLRECSDPNWPFPYNNIATLPGGAQLAASFDPAGRKYVVPGGLTFPNGAIRVSLTPRSGELFDAWRNPFPWQEVDKQSGTLLAYRSGVRSDDVILTNVLSFDVKMWDPWAPQMLYQQKGTDPTSLCLPGDVTYLQCFDFRPPSGSFPGGAALSAAQDYAAGFGAFVDLWGFRDIDAAVAPSPPLNQLYQLYEGAPVGIAPPYRFLQNGNLASGVASALGSSPPYNPPYPAVVYDTWSTSYEQDGIDQDAYNARVVPGWSTPMSKQGPDEGTDGIDNDGVNGVDDPGEQEAPPPYPYPLKAIQVKIRVFDPDSRQVREVTLVHEFLPN